MWGGWQPVNLINLICSYYLIVFEKNTLNDVQICLFLEGSCKRMFEERTKLDIKFETVKEFIGVSDSLNILVKETEEKLSRLQSNREELDEMRENIKEQAVKALN